MRQVSESTVRAPGQRFASKPLEKSLFTGQTGTEKRHCPAGKFPRILTLDAKSVPIARFLNNAVQHVQLIGIENSGLKIMLARHGFLLRLRAKA